MLFIFIIFAVAIGSYPNVQAQINRISGGQFAQIIQYPETVALLRSNFGTIFVQTCAGTILTKKSILTVAHCINGDRASQWRGRVGSSYANSGGTVYNFRSMIIHPSFNKTTLDGDIAILKTTIDIVYSILVKEANIASSNYNLTDNQAVWAVGWGKISYHGLNSEQLRQVQLWTINQEICRTRFATVNNIITDNMLCAGWLDVGGRDQCQGDSGGPLYHNGNIVGICSWGKQCALGKYPGVNTRISRFTPWLQRNA